MDKTPHIPSIPKQMLVVLGKMLIIARKEKHWRQADVALRLGVSRQTIARMEQGDPMVAAGSYFSLAWLLNVPVLPGMELAQANTRNIVAQLIHFLQKQLPGKVHSRQEKPIDDNF